jgi:hypothetical protein
VGTINTVGMTPAQIDAASNAACTATGGKWVQKGIAARVLEYADSLTAQGYVPDPAFASTNGFNQWGRFVFKTQPDGTPIIAGDPALVTVAPNSAANGPSPLTCDLGAPVDCDPNTPGSCTPADVHPAGCTPLTIYDNHFAQHLANYKSVPDYLWEVIVKYGLGTPSQLAVYP